MSVGQLSESTGPTEAQANISRVIGAYEDNQGQMGQVLEEHREMKQLQ